MPLELPKTEPKIEAPSLTIFVDEKGQLQMTSNQPTPLILQMLEMARTALVLQLLQPKASSGIVLATGNMRF